MFWLISAKVYLLPGRIFIEQLSVASCVISKKLLLTYFLNWLRAGTRQRAPRLFAAEASRSGRAATAARWLCANLRIVKVKRDKCSRWRVFHVTSKDPGRRFVGILSTACLFMWGSGGSAKLCLSLFISPLFPSL